MGLFKRLFSGLNQTADDDVNGLVTVMIACLIDEDNYKNYRAWFVEKINENPHITIDALSLGIFTTLTEQAADRERRGIRQGIDDALWKIRQGELSI